MNETLVDLFRHSAWATRALIEACRGLSAEQLARPARGFGSILATFHHVVTADAGYAAMLGGMLPAWARDESEAADLDGLAARAGEIGRIWEGVLGKPIDPERLLILDDGSYEVRAGIVVAQALHHANVHREQIRAALKDLGARPPDLQPWAYADATGLSRWPRGRPTA